MLAASSTMIHTRSQAVCMVWVYLLSMHSQNGSMSRYTETARYTTRATGMAHPQVKWKPQVLLQIQVQRSRSCQALRMAQCRDTQKRQDIPPELQEWRTHK